MLTNGWRQRGWEITAVVLAALIMGYALLIRPLIGLADNGDFLRITGTLGLTDAQPGESYVDRFFGYAHVQFAHGPWRPGGYISTQLLPGAVAELLGVIWPGSLFDIRQLAVVYTLLLLIALWLAMRWARPSGLLGGLLLLALLLVVFVDTGYTAYFNSFFGEPTTYVFLLLSLAIGFRLVRAGTGDRLWAALFMAAAIMMVGSKTQTAPCGLVYLLLGVRLWRMHAEPGWRLTLKRWMIGLAVASVLTFLISPPSMDRINKYQAVFDGILKDSPAPANDLRALGLDPALAVNAGTDYFTANTAIPQQDPRFDAVYRKVGFVRIGWFYALHPVRLLGKLNVLAEDAWTIRPYYLGNYAKEAGKPRGAVTHFFTAWSDGKNRLHPHGFGWIAGIYVLYAAGLWLSYRRARTEAERFIPDLFAAVAVIGAIAFLVPLVGSGEADLAKHLFLFTLCLDIMLVSSLVWALGRLLRWTWPGSSGDTGAGGRAGRQQY